MASDIINIDGSILEGGGQILRNAAALSCILNLPICINNIRAGRDNPGLRPQHLSGLEVVRDLSQGKLEDARVSSQNITFFPNKIQSGSYLADTKTAGSICLLIQAALPCMLFAAGSVRLQLKGGTNASFAPQFDYFAWIFNPTLEKLGIKVDCKLLRRGFYPKGGGEVIVEATPVPFIKSFDLVDRGNVVKILGFSFVAGTLPIKIAHSMADAARSAVRRAFSDVSIKIDVVKASEQEAFGNGCGIILVAETSTGCRIAGTGLGSRGVSAEVVGQQAGDELLHNLGHGGCVDDYLQDQLIILMALARGVSRVRCGELTLHTETAIHVAQLLTKAKFKIHKESPSCNIIECEGIGFENRLAFQT